jgi:hypothetical protein
MSSTQTITFKVTFEGETRRIHSVPTWEGISSEMKALFFQLPTPLGLTYVDEAGDVITVSSENEFQEALRIMNAISPNLKYFRFLVSAPKTPKIQILSEFQSRKQTRGEFLNEIRTAAPLNKIRSNWKSKYGFDVYGFATPEQRKLLLEKAQQSSTM